MAFFAHPPYLSMRPRSHVAGRQDSVPARVPLQGHLGMRGRQVVFSPLYGAVGADRTAGPRHTGFDNRLPLMPTAAHPPHQPVAAGQHLFRGERLIFLRMPLLCNFRKLRRKICLPRNGQLSRTVRAPCSCTCTCIHRTLPFVPVFALPPYPSAASAADGIRRQLPVLFTIPLAQQFGPSRPLAKLTECLPYVIAPSALPR